MKPESDKPNGMKFQRRTRPLTPAEIEQRRARAIARGHVLFVRSDDEARRAVADAIEQVRRDPAPLARAISKRVGRPRRDVPESC